MIGLIQATEVIKLLLNIGTTLCGRLLSVRRSRNVVPAIQGSARSGVRDVRSECAYRSGVDSRVRVRRADDVNAEGEGRAPIHVGDFVYCRSKYYRDQLQLPEELGLVIEIKRNNFKILYPNDKRCWLPREAIARVRPEQLDYAAFLEKLHYLIKKVHALECELVSEDGSHRSDAAHRQNRSRNQSMTCGTSSAAISFPWSSSPKAWPSCSSNSASGNSGSDA